MDTTTKLCPGCGRTKFLDEFSVVKATGRPVTKCKSCVAEWFREKRKSDPTWNVDRNIQVAPDFNREDYRLMLQRQNGVCAVCGYEPGPGKVFLPDRGAASGPVIGLLCPGCMKFVKLAEWDIDFVVFALQYLRGGMHG